MTDKCIIIKGAAEHNLKNIEVMIPREKFVVITGVSGSGKSSLAFDTIYAEGQRRYLESLSTYARQFLGQLSKPNVESIEGLPPTIAITQRQSVSTPRSTVATQTEIYDFLRVLFAKVGTPYCYKCGKPIQKQTIDEMVDYVLTEYAGKRIQILAPVVRGEKGEHKELFKSLRLKGFEKIRLNNEIINLTDNLRIDEKKRNNIDVVVDSLVIKPEAKSRVNESISLTLNLSNGIVTIYSPENKKEKVLNQNLSCIKCKVDVPEISPRVFSFNSPYGACSECDGLGIKMEIDKELLIHDKTMSINEGAIAFIENLGRYYWYFMRFINELCEKFDIDRDIPIKNIPEEKINMLFYGCNGIKGLVSILQEYYYITKSELYKKRIEEVMTEQVCSICDGARLKKEYLSIKIEGLNIYDITKKEVEKAYEFFNNLKFESAEKNIIAQPVINILKSKLKFLMDVGVGYLTLDRRTSSLSGGEYQRVQLATQLGSGLVGVCYILDEPSIGLHMRDTERLINILKKLKDMGNTVIVVEHDEDTIRSADWIIDLGPFAGRFGGEVVAQGEVKDIINSEKSITGRYLAGEYKIPIPEGRRIDYNYSITVYGAAEHNLKKINVTIPLGILVCVTGVSGSGKSTLVFDILYKGIARMLGLSKEKPGAFDRIKGVEYIDKLIVIDQSPIGKTSRSNPATYVGFFDGIRYLFAQTVASRMKGFGPGRFSFNIPGGRCEACGGLGVKTIEMHFLPDIMVTCEVCGGRRYNRETLEVKYKGKSIYDVLEMSVVEALEFFRNIPTIYPKLKLISDVGLGYIKIGQSSSTLSGGEAQRIKLAYELSKPQTGHTLYLLDEPTTGLHMDDVAKLINVLQKLVDKGNTIIVIEHNPHIIKVADYIIDLGPEGGDKGGYIVACGRPKDIINNPNSYTGKFLKKFLTVDTKEVGEIQFNRACQPLQ